MPYSKLNATALRRGYRSGLEHEIAKQLEKHSIPVDYESVRIKYVRPARIAQYTPDFILPNGIIVETKGRFTSADRVKHLLIQEQFPELDIRFIFSNPNNKLNKRSKTTYGAWCERHGFLYAAKEIPKSWLEEPVKEIPYDLDRIYRRK